MTRFRAIAVAVVVGLPLVACGTTAQTAVSPERDAAARISADLQFLADDAREGRGVGTQGLEQAAAYIARAFQDIGLRPGGTDGYFQPFELDPRSPALAHTQLGGERVKNVIGVLPGRGHLASQVVVIGAHYDHLGLGTRGYIGFSRDTTGINVVHNGADDNASGTTALLETARNLARRQTPTHRTVVFVAFTAEELGTIGAMYYVEHPTLPTDSAIAMVNFDMVGRMSGDSVIVGGTGSAPELVPLLESTNARYRLNLVKQDDPWGSSDHAVFYGKETPVLHFYTNLHADYHTPADDWEKINVDGIVEIVALASDLVWAMATQTERMTYVAVSRPERTAGPRASLGTVPDMVTPGEGMRVQAVRAGTAADEAGLKAGDVVLRIGDVEVKDIYGLQKALTTYKTGDTVTIVFLRDGERKETIATLK
ncbi:MAG: M20/M25/M40 family metallo-hydrolase [Gemmatimonadota bacterium]|nr:M20/M25/M40 family metallo-hydrolase [Gemmatimonadota bacterium]MDH3367244.1 M20/M25/M40 family metallo-hydrolase [Gemmatimonadota bacterium]MDH3478400.1 M20/M25/M40 family metallo-hydrolase [Gemmatimonadota bacterium]MDH3570463.1 M20/M25/M40 family metallo-hydrolase [Gemmatimonadota bacterium]MDH5548948.1 M20/M25/M40 family metallo-hydrolase [Gemmatimonadota bacterium]